MHRIIAIWLGICVLLLVTAGYLTFENSKRILSGGSMESKLAEACEAPDKHGVRWCAAWVQTGRKHPGGLVVAIYGDGRVLVLNGRTPGQSPSFGIALINPNDIKKVQVLTGPIALSLRKGTNGQK